MRAPGGPRLLLRRLREIMAEPITAQARLDRIVMLIASNMVAEVCSLYVARADGKLELFANEGFKREAVHVTTMQPGEGLVGLIAATAEPLALADAQGHPSFSYKPETGEEVYHSFLGVPVLRNGQTLGVLVVQNKARRVYTEEEIEGLETTAMLVAEIVASGDLQTLAAQAQPIAVRQPLTLHGVAIAEGLGLGHAVLHLPRVEVTRIVADDVDLETTAMLVAEIVASGELQTLAAQAQPIAVHQPLTLHGVAIAEGLGLGHAVLHLPRVEVTLSLIHI